MRSRPAARLVRALSIAAVALASAAGTAGAARGVRLSWDGDPTTTVAVAWSSDDATDDQIQWGTSPTALGAAVPADMAISQPAPLGNAFVAHLTGLTPDTTYYYRVGGAGGVFHPAAPAAPFELHTRASDPCAPMRFILIGDNRADFDGVGPSPLWADILGEAMAFAPDFFLNTGDMVKNGDDPVEWSAFVDASEVGWSLVPSLLTMGNHDEDAVNGDAAIYNQLYALPTNTTTGTEDYYSIDVGPIHFVSLNTQFTSPGSTDFTGMVAWLDADLGATTQPWKIVFFHKAIYSRGNHSSGEENNGAINAAFIPVFDAHDVDFVFNGHSHDYERYAPSVGVDVTFGGTGRSFPAGDGSTIGDPLPDGATGTTYIVSGGAGALTTDVFGFTCLDAACSFCIPFGGNINCPDEVYDNDVLGTVTYDGAHNFTVVDVAGDTLTFEVWQTAAGNSGGASVIETFSMVDGTFPLTCSPVVGTDAGVPGSDAGTPGTDAATPGTDGGGGPGVDGAVGPGTDAAGGGGTDAGGDDSPGGCSCRCMVAAPAAVGPAGPVSLALVGLGGLLISLRRARRK